MADAPDRIHRAGVTHRNGGLASSAVYGYRSRYAHADGQAVSQLEALRAGGAESLGIFETTLRNGPVFMPFAVLDYCALFPDPPVHLTSRSKGLMADWIGIAGHFDCKPGAP